MSQHVLTIMEMRRQNSIDRDSSRRVLPADLLDPGSGTSTAATTPVSCGSHEEAHQLRKGSTLKKLQGWTAAELHLRDQSPGSPYRHRRRQRSWSKESRRAKGPKLMRSNTHPIPDKEHMELTRAVSDSSFFYRDSSKEIQLHNKALIRYAREEIRHQQDVVENCSELIEYAAERMLFWKDVITTSHSQQSQRIPEDARQMPILNPYQGDFSTSMRLKFLIRFYLIDCETPAGKALDMFLLLCNIWACIHFVVLIQMSSDAKEGKLDWMEYFLTSIFLVEYVLRMWATRDRVQYMSFYGLVDLLSILPGMIDIFGGTGNEGADSVNFGFLRVLRCLRVFKFFRYLEDQSFFFGSISSLQTHVFKAILTVFITMFTACGCFLTFEPETVSRCEHGMLVYNKQTEVFEYPYCLKVGLDSAACDSLIKKECTVSWPLAFYHTVITISTTGYGDFVPRTPAGQWIIILMVLITMALIPWQAGKLVSLLSESEELYPKRFVTCERCGLKKHDVDAVFCKCCGLLLLQTLPPDVQTARNLAESINKNFARQITINERLAKLAKDQKF